MAFESLLRPGKINGMEMRNRFIAGPMEKAMANLAVQGPNEQNRRVTVRRITPLLAGK